MTKSEILKQSMTSNIYLQYTLIILYYTPPPLLPSCGHWCMLFDALFFQICLLRSQFKIFLSICDNITDWPFLLIHTCPWSLFLLMLNEHICDIRIFHFLWVLQQPYIIFSCISMNAFSISAVGGSSHCFQKRILCHFLPVSRIQ